LSTSVRQGTFARTRGNDEDAPIPAIGPASTQLVKPTEAVEKRVTRRERRGVFPGVTVEMPV